MLELISDYIGSLFIIVFGVLFGKLVLGKKVVVNKMVLIFVVFIVSLLLQGLYLCNITILKSLFGFIVFFLIYRYIYDLDSGKAFLLSFFYILIVALCDILVIVSYVKIFGKAVFYNYIANSLISNFSVLVPLILFTLLFKRLMNRFLNIKVKHKLVILSGLVLICVVLIFYSNFEFTSNVLNNLFGFLCILSLALVLFDSFLQSYKNYKLTNDYDKLLEFIKKYEIEIENQRTYRHETRNQLLTIKSKIIDNDKSDNIIKYIDEIIKDNNVVVNHSEYAKLRYLPSNGIKGLFYFKVSEAVEKGINIDINISKCIEDSFIKSLNSVMFNQLGKVLGIFLDNAIEGAVETCSKNIGIEIYCDDGDICFIISNTYEKIVNNGYFSLSTKGVGRGHGLILAKRIIEGNACFINYTEVTDKLYIQKLIIKK